MPGRPVSNPVPDRDAPSVTGAVWRAMRRFQELTARRPAKVAMHPETHRAFRREFDTMSTSACADFSAAFGMPVEDDERMPEGIVRVIYEEDEVREGGLEQSFSQAVAEPVFPSTREAEQ